ncbi:MAG: chromosome partitioning protein ParA, partial [Deltaproteobacteria bacterium HGW-Deltaproteobacteria-20]
MRDPHGERAPSAGGDGRGCAAADGDARRQQEALEVKMLLIRHKFLVLSGKGGVGKSTVAVNLASALATAGRRVGLLDVDLHGPSVPGLLGLDYTPQPGRAGGIAPAQVTDNFWAMSIQFFLPADDDAVIWRGPRKYSAIREMLSAVDWGHLDCLVVDAPPGTGDEALALVELLGSGTGAIVVSTPQRVAVSDVRKALKFCATLELPVIGVIENMSGFVCPHCGETTDVFLSGGAETMAADVGVPFLGRIPMDPEVVQAGERGVPHVVACAGSPTAAAFARAIEPLLQMTERPVHHTHSVAVDPTVEAGDAGSG